MRRHHVADALCAIYAARRSLNPLMITVIYAVHAIGALAALLGALAAVAAGILLHPRRAPEAAALSAKS